jgi:hypothetical protein
MKWGWWDFNQRIHNFQYLCTGARLPCRADGYSIKTSDITFSMKSALLFSTLLIAAAAFAQDDAHKLVVGGTFSYWHQTYNNSSPNTGNYQDVTSNRTTFSPYIGYRAFKDGMIGLQGSFGLVKETVLFNGIPGKVVHDGLEFGVGGFARKYFKLHEDFRLFLEGGVRYNKGSHKSDNQQVAFGPAKSYHNFVTYISPGLTWSITNRFNLVGMFGQMAYVKGRRVGLFETEETPFSFFEFQLRGNGFRLGAELKF